MTPINLHAKWLYKNQTISIKSEKININLDNNRTILYYLYNNNKTNINK